MKYVGNQCSCEACRSAREGLATVGMQVQGSSIHSPSREQLAERRNPEVQSTKPMLHRAEELINGARQQDYGDKLRNFGQIADLWTAHLKYKLGINQVVTAEDVALMMINVKQARLAKSPTHADSVIDIAGYIGCYDKILDERLELAKRDTSDDIGKMYR